MRRGFTLVELLAALAVLALIAALAATALSPSLQGWQELAEARKRAEMWLALDRRLRSDLWCVRPSLRPGIAPIAIENDSRGDRQLDRLRLLAATGETPSLSRIEWRIDEETGHLLRIVRDAWAEEAAEPVVGDFGPVASFSVEALGEDGNWHENWGQGAPFAWPKLLRVRVRAEGEVREFWLAPLAERAL